MNGIYATDISDRKEFTFQGDRLEQYKSYGDGWWLYKRYNQYSDFHFMGWELVKSVRHKNPDGEMVYTYPSSEQFGTYGLFLPQRYAENDCDLAHIKKVEEDSKKSSQKP